jgi:hypothetical protein
VLAAPGDDLAKLVDRARRALAQPAHVPARQRHEQHRRRRAHRRRALRALEDAHLPDDVARPEVGDVLAVALDARRALLDREHVVGVVALADELLALGHRHLGGERGDVVQLVVAQVGEHGDLPQARGVQRRPPIRAGEGGRGC